MDSLAQYFKANEVIVYSVYGQVFFVMGVAIAVHSMQHSRLHMARHLWLLAGFGLTHGLVEWGDVFIPIQAAYMPEAFVRGLYGLQFVLLVVSFVLLLAFGAGVAFRASREGHTLAVGLPLAMWALVVMVHALVVPDRFLLIGEIWARYLIAIPACVLTGIGLLREAEQVASLGLPRIARHLRVATGAIWLYGAFSGLVTPAYDSLLLARWVNKDIFFHVVGLPIPVVRSLAALIVAYGIIRSLDVFRVEADRLLQEARDQKLLIAQRELEALSAVGVAVGQSPTLDVVLENGLRRVLEILHLDRGAVFLTSGDPPAVTSILCTCAGVEREKGPTCIDCRDLAMKMLAAREPVMLHTMPGGEHGLGIALAAGGVPLGAMTLCSPHPLQLPAQAGRLLTSIGMQIGVAVENARLWEEVRRKEAVREQLLQRVITAQEEERKRIARELHDDTGQVLTALVIELNAAMEALPPRADRAGRILDQASHRLRHALDDIRKLIADLRPTLLDDLGLVPALRRHLESTGAIHGLRMRLRADGLPARLPSHIETALYRIVQEGVTNAVKHAEASAVSVTLAKHGHEVTAQVYDNGRGFDAAQLDRLDPNHGFGLIGMQERLALLGGTLETRSEPRGGTLLLARIPLVEEDAALGQYHSADAGR